MTKSLSTRSEYPSIPALKSHLPAVALDLKLFNDISYAMGKWTVVLGHIGTVEEFRWEEAHHPPDVLEPHAFLRQLSNFLCEVLRIGYQFPMTPENLGTRTFLRDTGNTVLACRTAYFRMLRRVGDSIGVVSSFGDHKFLEYETFEKIPVTQVLVTFREYAEVASVLYGTIVLSAGGVPPPRLVTLEGKLSPDLSAIQSTLLRRVDPELEK